MRALIVDDDRDHADSVSDLLAMRGIECVLAASGEAGIACLHQSDYDIVFMDVKLPGMSGIEAFYALRKLRPGLRVMFMTGLRLESGVADAVASGALGVLHKPFASDELLRAVDAGA